MINKILLGTCFCFLLGKLHAQQPTQYTTIEQPSWVLEMYQPQVNLFALREAYEKYYTTHPFEKNTHTQYFKRLMKTYWNTKTEDGFLQTDYTSPDAAVYLATKKDLESQKSATSQWEEMGPWDYDHEQAIEFEVQSPGSSHVYTIEQAPSNDNIVFAGTATAGLWKTIDKGLNWELQTRSLLVNSVYAIAINPNNENEVFFGEENGTIWKSIDGGVSWTKTGTTAFQNDSKWTRDLKWIGQDSLLAATSKGLFRTINGGDSWTKVQNGEHMEIEIHPTNAAILYTVQLSGSSTLFYKSTDYGTNWVLKPTGWPAPTSGQENRRTEIAVSNADPNIVYAWAAGAVGSSGGLYGVYKSTDEGETFSFVCCGGTPGTTSTDTDPNLLGYSAYGTEEGGQYYYDLAFGVSPTQSNKLFGAGINVWRSEDSGANWELNSHWVTWVGEHTKYRYSHADVQDIKFFETNTGVDMWIVSDGGIYYSSNQGDTLVPRMHGIHGTDFWGYQAGFKNGNVMLGGTYHNGTLIRYNDIYQGGNNPSNPGGWLAEMGGDNFRGFVNYGNPKLAYTDNGAITFSEIRENRITSAPFESGMQCNTSYLYGEAGNYGYFPDLYNSFYSPVGDKLMRTDNAGGSFYEVADFNASRIIQVKIAWSNPSIVYVTKRIGASSYKIMKSIDAGLTWTDVTPNGAETGNQGNRAKYIEVDDQDPNKIWCILMGVQTGNKVFQSIDGGDTWTNITSSNINAENVVSIFHHYGTDDGLYLGTTRAVYYKNASMNSWELFSNNLPASTSAVFLEPFYGGGKVRTATQRGTYECDFYEDVSPIAMLSSDKKSINLASNCGPDEVQFIDHSTCRNASASWEWIFEGGTPSSSTLENPIIVYTTDGDFDVTLTVTDEFGSHTIVKENFIVVTSNYTAQHLQEGFENEAFPPANWELSNTGNGSWEKGTQLNASGTNYIAQFPNYWEDASQAENLMLLPAMNLEQSISPSISFEYTYNSNGEYLDSLALLYRTGSNPTWQTIWQKGGEELTVPGTEVWFWYYDTADVEWETVNIDLGFLIGENCVEFTFENKGLNGNHIWLDNVNLNSYYAEVEALDPTAFNVNVFPNPSTDTYQIRWQKNNSSTELSIQSISGKQIMKKTITSSENETQINLANYTPGVYLLHMTQNNRVITKKLILQ